MSKQEVIICHNLEENLNKAINQCPHDKLFVWNLVYKKAGLTDCLRNKYIFPLNLLSTRVSKGH